MSSQRWLLCTHHLLDYSGSEVVTLELAEELMRAGHQVTLFSPFQGPEFAKTATPDGVALLSEACEIDVANFDVIYCQHQSVSLFMAEQDLSFITSRNRPIFVYNHLSPFEPLEAPGPFVEEIFADIILCNSRETQDSLPKFGERFTNVTLFPNPAPMRFSTTSRAKPLRPKRIVSISNHIPKEMKEAFKLLEGRGIEVVRIGRSGVKKRLELADFENCDAVVTIGKSAQYAIRAQLPIFCYDHFGGPGWITEANFEAASAQNFSGRCCPVKRMPNDLADEIVGGVQSAKIFPSPPAEYCLEVMVKRLLDSVQALAAARAPLTIDAHKLRYMLTRERSVYMLVDREYGKKRDIMLKRSASEEMNRHMRAELKRLKRPSLRARFGLRGLRARLLGSANYVTFIAYWALGHLPILPRQHRERFLMAARRRGGKLCK